MRHTTLIMFIATMFVAALAIGVISSIVSEQEPSIQPAESADGPRITQVELYGVDDGSAGYVRFEIHGGGDPVQLDSSLVQVRVDEQPETYPLQ